jgi:hypothetical protein
VVKKDEQIVGHGGIWPLHFAGQLKVIHLIDWAASRTATGAGVLMLKKLAGLSDLLLTIGGSDDTRNILPRLGYKQAGEMKMQVKVVRPWLQFRKASNAGWKAPLRLARNTIWSLSSLPSVPKGWRTSRVSRFDFSMENLLGPSQHETLRPIRSVAGLNHILTCPAASFSAFQIFKDDEPGGYFVLSEVNGQTRIADLRLASENRETWKVASILAAEAAAAMPETCEIVAGFCAKQAHESFEQIGFRVRKKLPIFYYDPRKLLGNLQGFDLSLLDGDGCFMANLKQPFLT